MQRSTRYCKNYAFSSSIRKYFCQIASLWRKDKVFVIKVGNNMGHSVGYKDQCKIPTRLTTFAFLLIHTQRSEEALVLMMATEKNTHIHLKKKKRNGNVINLYLLLLFSFIHWTYILIRRNKDNPQINTYTFARYCFARIQLAFFDWFIGFPIWYCAN